MLRYPCSLRDPQERGTKSEVVTSPLPSRDPKRGRKSGGGGDSRKSDIMVQYHLWKNAFLPRF